MDSKLRDATVRNAAATQGSINGVGCHPLMMKGKDCVVKLMNAYGSLSVGDDAIESVQCTASDADQSQRQRVAFKHAECYENHYNGCNEVDNCNHSRFYYHQLKEHRTQSSGKIESFNSSQ